ncbi:hypothetical protein B0H14DRAFT_3513684 [Mycena olivaceomarginata]|nr:hypothetical protein B0H14DRAFT_3513684 [Mycena olivaceomarginata]
MAVTAPLPPVSQSLQQLLYSLLHFPASPCSYHRQPLVLSSKNSMKGMSLAVPLPFVSLATSYNPLMNLDVPLLLNIQAGTTPAALPPRPRGHIHPIPASRILFRLLSHMRLCRRTRTFNGPTLHNILINHPVLSTPTLTVSNTVLYERWLPLNQPFGAQL